MICKNSNCKAELPDNAVFCLKCGTKQDISEKDETVFSDDNIIESISEKTTEEKTKKVAFIIIGILVLIALLYLIYVISNNNTLFILQSDISTPTPLTTTITLEPQKVYNYYSLERCPVKVKEIHTISPNSAGGIDLIIYWNTISQQEIKYIYLYATPYNRVGDIESSEIGGTTTTRCRMIGPYNAGDGGRAEFENVWYNSAISETKINKIEIEYANGETIIYEGEEWIYQ